MVMPATADPLLQLLLELLADHLGMAAQGRLLMLDIVIGIFGGDRPDRALDLDEDELVVIVDVEQRLGGVGDPPDDVGGDLDRVAAQVVHLEPLRGDVVDPGRDLGPGQPGPAPAQAGGAVGALIVAEQQDRRRLVRLEQIEAGAHEQDDEQRRGSERRPRRARLARTDEPSAGDRHGDEGQQQDEQHHIAAVGVRRPLARQPQRLMVGMRLDRVVIISLL